MVFFEVGGGENVLGIPGACVDPTSDIYSASAPVTMYVMLDRVITALDCIKIINV